MSEEIIVMEEEVVEVVASPAETSRRVVMASIGVVVVAGGEMKSAVNRLVERGSDGRPTLPLPARPSLRRQLRKPVTAVLNRLNLPTKTDIDALNDQVTTLLEKIERLQQQEQGEGAEIERSGD
jgi:hypothetical protein